MESLSESRSLRRQLSLDVHNPSPTLLCACGARQATFHGSGGSSWSTREQRMAAGWPDVGPPENIVTLSEVPPVEWEGRISLQPRYAGEQAGLYAYASEASWVKLVVEGGRDGIVYVVFAQQLNGVPMVAGKLPLPNYAGFLWLRLTGNEAGGAVASYRLSDSALWESVPRGLGWLSAPELEQAKAEGAVREDAVGGSLAMSDARGTIRAMCRLPDEEWRAALVTEQWAADAAAHAAHAVDDVHSPIVVNYSHLSATGELRPAAASNRRRVVGWQPAAQAVRRQKAVINALRHDYTTL